jgi:predicted transcriptional regulator of viral defense system
MFIPDRILLLLAERPSMTRAAIRAALSDSKRVAVNAAIARLEDKGLIDAIGWGRYRLAVDATISHTERPAKSMHESIRRTHRG